MGKVLNLKEEVDKMHEVVTAGLTPELLECYNKLKPILEDCFISGVFLGAGDSMDTLADYATACAGLPAENIYDQANDSLSHYWTDVIAHFEKGQDKGESIA